jgi:hypothetical protein
VLLLADAEGRVEKVLNLSKKDAKAFDRQAARLGLIRLDWPRPDEEPFKALARALLACSTASGCALVLDLPGMMRLPKEGSGSIRIVSLDPKDGAGIVHGQRVTLTATVRYQIDVTPGVVALVVQDQAGKLLMEPPPFETVATRSGQVTLTGTFTVPEDATRIEVRIPLGAQSGLATPAASARYAVTSR